MRLKSDGHGEVQIFGPQGDPCNIFVLTYHILHLWTMCSSYCHLAALEAQLGHSKSYLTAIYWEAMRNI